MDQAISLLAEKGTAKLIEFNPLKTYDVKLPEGYILYVLIIFLLLYLRASFVIANCLVESHKQLMGSKQFNLR